MLMQQVSLLLGVGVAAAGIEWGVQPPTTKLMIDAVPEGGAQQGSSNNIDLAAQLGECEAQQVWLRSTDSALSAVSLKTAALVHSGRKSTLAASHWTWFQQLYVNCSAHNTTTMYQPSAPGWWPDPLLETQVVPEIPQGSVQPLWVELCVPYNAEPGIYFGSFALLAAPTTAAPAVPQPRAIAIPVKVQVWDIAIRNTSDSAALSTHFSFGQAPLTQWQETYTGLGTPWLSTTAPMMKWLRLLQRHRTPADSIYYPNANYFTTGPSTWCGSTHCRRSSAQIRQTLALGLQRININDLASGRENYTDEAYLAAVVGAVNASIFQLVEALDGDPSSPASVDAALERAYVYSFDELPMADIQAIYKIYGAVKQVWPKLQTMATLPDGRKFGRKDWIRLPEDLPVDVWVDQYDQLYDDEKLAAVHAWTSTPGKHYYWYWGIGPHKSTWLNTFVERQAIEARLLLWLASLNSIRGILYYEVAQTLKWRSNAPMRRQGNGTMLVTDFSPASWPDENAGSANGDGNFIYPCENGPCSTIRLKNLRDGIEDLELFSRLSWAQRAPLLRQLIRNGTDWNDDPALLERVRREAAARIMALADRTGVQRH